MIGSQGYSVVANLYILLAHLRGIAESQDCLVVRGYSGSAAPLRFVEFVRFSLDLITLELEMSSH